MKWKFTLVLGAIFGILNLIAQNPINHTYPLNDGPNKNPMKGWSSGWWDNFDQSSVGFQYIKWNEFETTDEIYDWDYIESLINREGSSGKHLILRLYADWFGADPVSDACPQWIYDDYGVQRLQSPSGKYITDFNDPNYVSQAVQAIEALTNRYDTDPRIYSLQIGILGYWGEWHTFTYNDSNGNNMYPLDDAVKSQIVNTYKNNLTNAKLMGRQPWGDVLNVTGGIGFHNDFFVPNNGHSTEFDVAVEEDELWRQGPIGGENPPIDEEDQEQYKIDLYETNEGMNMITTGHYSTMKLGSDVRPCEGDPTGAQCQGFLQLYRKMGYNFQIESALFPESITQDQTLEVAFNISNIGVAPMYFDWDIQFALLNSNNEAVEVFDVLYDLTTVMPQEENETIVLSTSLNGIIPDNYQLAVRLIQPEADIAKENPWGLDARNTFIRFSNDLPEVDGTWNSNNALIGGWSLLGPVALQESTQEVPNVLVFHKTNGFRHGSIDEGIDLISDLGTNSGLWTTTDTQDASDFNTDNLNNFDLVVWCNTSGNNLLNEDERNAFETWIENGGAFMGIHAATDTYRNGSWPFYNELVGAIVQTSPNHTSNNFNATMDLMERHASTDHLDDSTGWNKNEEYYYWEQNGGQLSNDNNNVLFVESTGSNSYDAARPMAWYKTSITVGGETIPVRSFYTALGHNGSDYENNSNFQQHIDGAIRWLLPALTTTYTNGSWSNQAPDGTMSAIFDASYSTASGDIIARDIEITANNTVTVVAGTTLEARASLEIEGSLLVQHQGSVLQTEPEATSVNNGSVEVQMTTAALSERDFMLTGSPMDNESVLDVFSTASIVRVHDTNEFELNDDVTAVFGEAINFADQNTTTTNDWSGQYNGALQPARGYFLKPQENTTTEVLTYDFSHTLGDLNSGDINFNTVIGPEGAGSGSPNIVSNPYASAISATAFMNDNGLSALYFWEHNTQPEIDFPGQYSVNYTMEDVSSINAAGIGNPAASGGDAPSDVISSMQGFAVRAPDADPLLFRNRHRILSENNTLRNSETNVVDVIRLQAKSDVYEKASNTTIAFLKQGTRSADAGLDNLRMATIVSLYSLIDAGGDTYGIQCREPFTNEMIIPIGFSTLIDEDTSYTISMRDLLGDSLSEATPFLIDHKEKRITNLSISDYNFTSSMGQFDNRFTLVFEEKSTLSTLETMLDNILIYPNPSNSSITISSPSSPIEQIAIYDVLGRQVLENTISKESSHTMDISSFQNAVYIVRIITTDTNITKQIIKK